MLKMVFDFYCENEEYLIDCARKSKVWHRLTGDELKWIASICEGEGAIINLESKLIRAMEG